MNNFRKGVTMKAFKSLDKEGTGEVDLHEIERVYCATSHPDVISRKKTKDNVLKEFIETLSTHLKLAVVFLLYDRDLK